MRILYVDDCDTVRFLFPQPEAAPGAPVHAVREVVFVTTRAAAFEELARVTFDAVVLDLGLPDAPNPLTLAREIRAKHAGRLIIASGNDRAPAIAEDPDVGAVWLMKPFGHLALRTALGLAA